MYKVHVTLLCITGDRCLLFSCSILVTCTKHHSDYAPTDSVVFSCYPSTGHVTRFSYILATVHQRTPSFYRVLPLRAAKSVLSRT